MTFLRRYLFRLVGVAITALAVSQTATVQAEPVQPLRLIVPCAAGSPNDLMARIIAQGLANNSGRPVVVENIERGADDASGGAAAQMPADADTIVFQIAECGDKNEGPRTTVTRK